MASFGKLLIAGLALLQPLLAASSVTLSGPPGPVRAGHPVTVTVSIAPAPAAETVTFTVDGTFAGTAVLPTDRPRSPSAPWARARILSKPLRPKVWHPCR